MFLGLLRPGVGLVGLRLQLLSTTLGVLSLGLEALE